jgi:hypothetical protein
VSAAVPLLLILVAAVVATLIGYFLTSLFLPSRFSPLAWAFAPGMGAGVCSLIFFGFRRPMFTVELAVLVTLFLIWRRYHNPPVRKREWFPWPVGALVLALVFSALITRADRMPHGGWDAWSTWNTHARVLYRAGSHWKEIIPFTSHPDYPLLTPAMTARFWRYAGVEIPEAGALLGTLFAFSGVAVLVATLLQLRSWPPGIGFGGGLMLVGTPAFLNHATSQYADVPLSFFMLATIALICLYSCSAPRRASPLILAGFAAGCAGWTKNEGLLFIAAVLCSLTIRLLYERGKAWRHLAWFSGGLLAPLAAIIFFKVAIAPQNEIIRLQSYHDTLLRLLDGDRYVAILAALARTLWSFGLWDVPLILPLLVFAALKGFDKRVFSNFGWRVGAMSLGIVFSGYLIVYVITPYPLDFHLASSLDRLLLHLWPSVLLLGGWAMAGRADAPGSVSTFDRLPVP